MMFESFPKNAVELLNWQWPDYEPYVQDLLSRDLTPEMLDGWLDDWSTLLSAVNEVYNRLYVAHTANTADEQVDEAYMTFISTVMPAWMEAEQSLKQKLLASRLEPKNFRIPMRNFRAEAELFRDENVPLLAEEQALTSEYEKISGAQTVEWQGAEVTLMQLQPIYQVQDRSLREQAWTLAMTRALADRQALNSLWVRLYQLRQKIAANAGRKDYREYRWQQLLRFDYTPEDAARFHKAIEAVAVPATERILERRKARLALEALRPWDVQVDPLGREPLRPFRDVNELIPGVAKIFHTVDPQLGSYFDIMVQEDLLDLDNRKNKAPGGYCIDFSMVRRPFIFMNAVGIHDDVQTLLHEGGHSFHVFETIPIKRAQELSVPSEFAEVASIGMEFLSAPFLGGIKGGFYTLEEAARARIEHLEGSISFWPYMAVVDAFQHWVYTHPQQAMHPENCDKAWDDLAQRFMPGIDWSGLEEIRATGWQRKLHIYLYPFYYVDYGLAQLGAVQVWRNWMRDPEKAIHDYRSALALGGTASLPELYRAAGAKLAFDEQTLGEAVALMEQTIQDLDRAQ